MALTEQELNDIYTKVMSHWSRSNTAIDGMNKNDLSAAVTAVDDWIEANQASFNNALPTAAKNGLSAGQKALLLAIVALARFAPNLLKNILGGS